MTPPTPPPPPSATNKSSSTLTPQPSTLEQGQVLIFALTMLSVLILIGGALLSLVSSHHSLVRYGYNRTRTLALAEAGIDHTIRQLNLNGSYAGTSSPISLEYGEFETTISGTGMTRQVTSTAYVPTKANYKTRRSIRVTIVVNTTNIAFNYGVQAGEGGITMENNSSINGNVYSNGSIQGSGSYENRSSITGTAIVAGGTAATPNPTWETTNGNFPVGNDAAHADVAQSFTAAQSEVVNKISLYLKKQGNPTTNRPVHILTDNGGKPSRTSVTSGTLYASQITGTYGWIEVTMTGTTSLNAGTTYWICIDSSADASNYWFWGIDSPGGYAGGLGKYTDNWNKNGANWSSAGGDLAFKLWSGGVDTFINTMAIGEDAYSHLFEIGTVGQDFEGYRFYNGTVGSTAKSRELNYCTIGGSVWVYSLSSCTIGGSTNYTGPNDWPPDKPPENFPISQANIDQWKVDAAATIYNGDYTPVGDTPTLGPIRINGNLNFVNNQIVTLTGTVYVTGTITFANNNQIHLHSDYGDSSGIIITDGNMAVNNNAQFFGSGQPNTYILLLSTSSSLDPANPAINLLNNADSAIAYAHAGLVKLNNNFHVKEATGYKLHISQNASVTYESGLQNALFTSGPGAGWQLKPSSWREVTPP